MAGESSALFDQFNKLDLPALQKLFPELEQLVSGGGGPLMDAAQAPVNAATSRALNTMQNNLGGVANPNMLYSDIAREGSQNAALAGDGMLSQGLSALQSLIGMGYGGVSTGTSALNSAAAGEGQLGLNLNEQGNEWWKALLQAGGQAAAMSAGMPPSPNTAAQTQTYGPQGTPMGGGAGANFGNPFAGYFSSAAAVAPSLTQGSNASAPISSAPSYTVPGAPYAAPIFPTGS